MPKRKTSITKFDERGESNRQSYFELIYNEYFERLYAYALVMTKSQALAQDVVSDVFYNLWNTKTDLQLISQLKAYLFTCVRNQAIKQLSDDLLRRNSDFSEKTIQAIDQIDPEKLMVGKELDQFINGIVNELPPQCALVFRLVKENQLKYQEVADELCISKDTVKYHLKTAIKKLKTEMASHFSEAKVIKWISNGTSVFFLSQVMNLLL